MHYSPVKRGDNRTFRMVTVIALVSTMILTSFMTVAEIASRDTPRPDLGIAAFYADSNKPNDGDTLTLSIVVRNYASNAAGAGELKVFEGSTDTEPLAELIIDTLPPDAESLPFTIQYPTTGMRGTRYFYAEISKVSPNEANTTGANNNATLEVPIFKDETGFDKIYEGNEVDKLVGIKEYKGFIALFDNSRVNMEQDSNMACNIKIVQDQDFQFGIELAGSTSVDIMGCSISSNYKFHITIMDNARLTIKDSMLNNATIRSLNTNLSASLTMERTVVKDGGLKIGTPLAAISDSVVSGDFVFTGGDVVITNTSFNLTKDAMASISNTKMIAEEISISALEPTLIFATDNSQVDLKTIWDASANKKAMISFDAKDTSRIQIWRKIDIHVYDTTDMPIKGATIQVYIENADYPANLNVTGISDENGNLSFTLLSDIIVAGNDGYRGNYEFVGIFTDDRGTTYNAFVTYKLAMHPNLSYNGSFDKLDVVFEPIPPKVCANPYKPTGTLISGATLAFYGCMQVTTPVTYVNSTITAIQDKDFQAAIYIESSGQLILQNTTITGLKRWNIYVIGPNSYLKSTDTMAAKSKIKANAIVGVEGNVEMFSVDINANIRGKYKSFTVGKISTIRGTWLTEAGGMTVSQTDIISPDLVGTSKITGGTVSLGGGLFYINHFEMSSTTRSVMSNADMWGNTMPAGDDVSYWRWYMPGSSFVISSEGECLVVNSQMHYDNFEMHCKAFNAEKASFNRDIVYGAEATSGSLKSVTAPAVKVLGDAIVKTYFIVDLMVTNSLDGPIGNAPITPTRMGGGSEEPPQGTTTGTDGKASFILLADKITSGNNHEWLGNYRIIINGCSDATAYEFSVGGGQGDQSYVINFPDCIPKIEGLQFMTLGLNKTIIAPPANDVSLAGAVRLTYEGGITTDPNAPVTIKVTLPSMGTNVTATTDDKGEFKTVLTMKNMGLMPADQLVNVEASYFDPSDLATEYKISQTLNISVLPEIPKSIQIKPMVGVFLTNKYIYEMKEDIVITGRAVYMPSNTAVPVGSVVRAQILGTTVLSTNVTGADGTFTIIIKNTIKPKKDTSYAVTITVEATHPYYKSKPGVPSSGNTMNEITIKSEKKPAELPIFLIIIVVIVIIIVAAVAGIFLYLRMKTWGTVVECGECGAFIPENAAKCPKCGTEFETEVVKCSECDAWIPALATECPKCGVEFKKGTGAAAGDAGGQPPAAGGGEQPTAQPVAKIPRK